MLTNPALQPDLDGRHDFDFLAGRWRIDNERLARRLHGSNHWQRFEAFQENRPLLGGLGNVDTYSSTFPDGRPLEGMTLRLFDPATGNWSIYWSDDRNPVLQPPVVGRFKGDKGAFFGDDLFEGRPIKVVYNWTRVSNDSALWDQAFSPDGGQNWETNWRMVMTRDRERRAG